MQAPTCAYPSRESKLERIIGTATGPVVEPRKVDDRYVLGRSAVDADSIDMVQEMLGKLEWREPVETGGPALGRCMTGEIVAVVSTWQWRGI